MTLTIWTGFYPANVDLLAKLFHTMIIRKLHKIQMQLALSLLIAFSGVFVCNFLCDLGILDIRIYSSRSGGIAHRHDSNHQHGHSENSGDHHNIHPAGEVGHQHKDNHTTHHQHNSNSEDECCEEETNQLLASLVQYELPKFETEKIPVLLNAVLYDIDFVSFHIHKNTDPYHLNSSLSPPVGGSFLRILYQSFLC